MNKIDIQVTKASIKSCSIEFDGVQPDVSATIALFTANDKEISTFSISTQNYYGKEQFELPIQMIPPIKEILNQLEVIAVQHCNKALCMIEVKTDE